MPNQRQAHLPQEIWQRIAEHMSSNDWAAISKINRTTYAVQPKTIGMRVGCKSDVTWVLTHCSSATSLKLEWSCSLIPKCLDREIAFLATLKCLHLRLDGCIYASNRVLRRVVAQAPSLSLLCIERWAALAPPRIDTLTNLIICSVTFSAQAISFRRLHNLRTLYIGLLYGLDGSASCAEVDLTGLPHLADVALVEVEVRGITLPRHSRLHVTSSRDAVLYMSAWDDSFRRAQLNTIDLRHCNGEMDEFPCCLLSQAVAVSIGGPCTGSGMRRAQCCLVQLPLSS